MIWLWIEYEGGLLWTQLWIFRLWGGKFRTRIVLYGAINEHRESTAVYESMCVNVRITFCSVWYRGVWSVSTCRTLLPLSSDRYVEYIIVFDPGLIHFIFKYVGLLLEFTFSRKVLVYGRHVWWLSRQKWVPVPIFYAACVFLENWGTHA
jgi:hypothetical protein